MRNRVALALDYLVHDLDKLIYHLCISLSSQITFPCVLSSSPNMSKHPSPSFGPEQPKNDEKVTLEAPDIAFDDNVFDGKDILALQNVDPALTAKMYIVNNVNA